MKSKLKDVGALILYIIAGYAIGLGIAHTWRLICGQA